MNFNHILIGAMLFIFMMLPGCVYYGYDHGHHSYSGHPYYHGYYYDHHYNSSHRDHDD